MLLSTPVRSKWLTSLAGNSITRLDFTDFSTSAGHLISSGGDFKITTTDCSSHPLPAWELLQIHWFLSRIMALSGTMNSNIKIGCAANNSWSSTENTLLNGG